MSSRAICRVMLLKLELSAIINLYGPLLRIQYFDKSAVAQNALENNHHIVFDEARLIDRASNYWVRIRREAVEIKLQPSNFNRNSGLHISKSWELAISTLRRLRARGQHSTSAQS